MASMNKEEAKKIANLARMEISNADAEKMAGEMEAILEYVDKIKEVSANGDDDRIESASVRNIFTEDENPHETGINTEKLLNEAPGIEQNMIKVKKIM